jgi:hypothetical protein
VRIKISGISPEGYDQRFFCTETDLGQDNQKAKFVNLSFFHNSSPFISLL